MKWLVMVVVVAGVSRGDESHRHHDSSYSVDVSSSESPGNRQTHTDTSHLSTDEENTHSTTELETIHRQGLGPQNVNHLQDLAHGNGELLSQDDTGLEWARSSELGETSQSTKVYSILALTVFTAFTAYIIYNYIISQSMRRSLLPQDGHYALLYLLQDVTRALGRWAVVEYLPEGAEDLLFGV